MKSYSLAGCIVILKIDTRKLYNMMLNIQILVGVGCVFAKRALGFGGIPLGLPPLKYRMLCEILLLFFYSKELEEDVPVLMTGVATHTYKGQFEDELSFIIGDPLDITADSECLLVAVVITVMFLQQNMIGGRKGRETNRAAAICFALAHNVTMFEVGSVIFAHNQRTTPVGSIGCQGDREREAMGALQLPIFNSWRPAPPPPIFCLPILIRVLFVVYFTVSFKTISFIAWFKNFSQLYSFNIYDRSQMLYISIFPS